MAVTSRKRTKKARCMIPGCENPEARRGLCEGCYRAARRKILDPHAPTTWAKLESAGLAKPLRPRGTPFKAEYQKRHG